MTVTHLWSCRRMLRLVVLALSQAAYWAVTDGRLLAGLPHSWVTGERKAASQSRATAARARPEVATPVDERRSGRHTETGLDSEWAEDRDFPPGSQRWRGRTPALSTCATHSGTNSQYCWHHPEDKQTAPATLLLVFIRHINYITAL